MTTNITLNKTFEVELEDETTINVTVSLDASTEDYNEDDEASDRIRRFNYDNGHSAQSLAVLERSQYPYPELTLSRTQISSTHHRYKSESRTYNSYSSMVRGWNQVPIECSLQRDKLDRQ